MNSAEIVVAPVVSGLILGASKLNIKGQSQDGRCRKKKTTPPLQAHDPLHPQKGSGGQLARAVRPSVDVIGAFLARDIDDMHQIPCKDATDQSAKKKGSVFMAALLSWVYQQF